MSASPWFARLFRRRAAPSTSGRVAVVPPSASAAPGWGGAEPVWTTWWPSRVGHPDGGETELLAQARGDFCAALDDLPGAAVRDLRLRATYVASLGELWHLRTELYSLIACERSQAEADRRLTLVNRHFPARISGHASTNEHHAHPSPFL